MSALRHTTSDAAAMASRYRTYKVATAKLAKWLATTAQSLGIESTTGSCASNDYEIKLDSFIELTNVIVEARPRVEVPLQVIDCARTAFKVRKEKAVLRRGTDLESDERHQYFISVIGEVLEKLEHHYQESASAHSRGTTVSKVNEDDNDDTLLPSFQLLGIDPLEDKRDEDEDENAVPSPQPVFGSNGVKLTKNQKAKRQKKKRKAKQLVQQMQMQDDDDDPHFVLTCLLFDLRSMREYVKEVWKEYREGKVDLITASLTTNAAFDIVRTFEDDFASISPFIRDYSKTVHLFLSRNAAQLGDRFDLFFASDTKVAHLDIVGECLARIPEVTDLVFAHAFYFLNGPRHVLVRKSEGQIQTIATHQCPFGKYNPKTDRSKLDSVERFKEDIAILASFALQVYSMSNFAGSTHDHFTRQWTEDFASTGDKTISLAQAFGAQIFLDIQHVLRQDSCRGLHDLCEASKRLDQSIESCRQRTPQDEYDDDPKFKVTQHNLRVAQLTLRTAVKHKDAYESHREKHRDLSLFIYYMEMHPLLCGIILFQTVHSSRNVGIKYATHWQSIRLAGQYYYGCQMQRDYWKSADDLYPVQVSFQKSVNAAWATPLVWKDMDYIFDAFSRKSFFEGHLPKTNREIAQYQGTFDDILESLGYDRMMSTRKKQSGHRGPILARPVKAEKAVEYAQDIDSYEPIAVTHRLYHSKYIKTKAAVEESRVDSWTSETLQALLQAHLQQSKRSKGGKVGTATVEQYGIISPVILLQTLKEALQRESRALCFDYIGFHTVCFDMLRTIREKTRKLLVTMIKSTDETFTDDKEVKLYLSALQVALNARPHENDKTAQRSNPTGDGPIFTNKGHRDIDAYIRMYLESNQCSDQELKRLDSIWGIAPPVDMNKENMVSTLDSELDLSCTFT